MRHARSIILLEGQETLMLLQHMMEQLSGNDNPCLAVSYQADTVQCIPVKPPIHTLSITLLLQK